MSIGDKKKQHQLFFIVIAQALSQQFGLTTSQDLAIEDQVNLCCC